jgi:heme-degrading monooxygenase HmoA
VIVREFLVNVGCEKDFELVFGPEGVWPGLLQSSAEGYLGTELQKDLLAERSFKVRDFWKSHLDFEAFRKLYQSDVEQFRKWLAGKNLVEKEMLLGSFYIDQPNSDEDAGLVPM